MSLDKCPELAASLPACSSSLALVSVWQSCPEPAQQDWPAGMLPHGSTLL